MKIFVSYTTRDKDITSELLNTVFFKLRKIGKVYIDLIHNDSINKQQRVLNELDTSDLVLLIKSDKNILSKWVRIETERANKKLIPIIKITRNEIATYSAEDFNRLFSSVRKQYTPVNQRGKGS